MTDYNFNFSDMDRYASAEFDIANDYRSLMEEIDKELGKWMKVKEIMENLGAWIGDPITDIIRVMTPIKTGRLRLSIHHTKLGSHVSWTDAVPYSGYVIHGHGSYSGVPFYDNAAEPVNWYLEDVMKEFEALIDGRPYYLPLAIPHYQDFFIEKSRAYTTGEYTRGLQRAAGLRVRHPDSPKRKYREKATAYWANRRAHRKSRPKKKSNK